MERRSLLEYLADFEQLGRKTAYLQWRGYRIQRWTYAQVVTAASNFARELAARGIRQGDRVLLWGENSAEWVAAFLGCVWSGAVAVPLDDISLREFAVAVRQQVSAKAIFVSSRHAGADVGCPALSLEDIAASKSDSPDHPRWVGLALDDPLEIVFTSGTTAEPKGVVITHGNVLANLSPLQRGMQPYLKYERLVHPIKFLNLLPLSHVFGQFLGIFLPPLLRGAVVFRNTMAPSDIISTIREQRVSVLVTVPRVLQSLRAKIERDSEGDVDFHLKLKSSSLRHFLFRWWIFRKIHRQFGWKFWAFLSGGAALDSATEEFWTRLGYATIQGYGLTETTSLISVNHPFHLNKGSIGKVLPGRESILADDGEILVRGGGVAQFYWSSQGEQPSTDAEGWYHTGDIGWKDAQGNLYFKGRKKETIVTPAGMKVYPADLEAALRLQPEVKDCVVIGLQQDGNAAPCAVMILHEAMASDARAVLHRANQTLAEYQRMNYWYVWPEGDFPRTSTQKAQLTTIQATVEHQFAGASPPAASRLSGILERVSHKNITDLSGSANLDSDLNLSSLDRVELISALEDRYQLDLSATRFSSLTTVGDLERAVLRAGPSGTGYHFPIWTLSWPLRWLRVGVYYSLIRPAIFIWGEPHVLGKENLRGMQGPLLIVSNHVSDVDAGLILRALPAPVRHSVAIAAAGEALEELRTPSSSRAWWARIFHRLEWLLGVALLNLFPLPREAGFQTSFRYAGLAADKGYSVLVFPEGRHTPDGKLLPFRAGIGLLANGLSLPVVPMRIDRLFEVKTSKRRSARRGTIQVRIGVPCRFAKETDPQQIADQLRAAVASL